MALHRKLQRTLSKNGWILHELWMVEKMDFEEKTIEWSLTSLGGGGSSVIWRPRKKVRKEPYDVQKKEKALKELVHAKEDKGYDVKECRFVDKTIEDEYSMWFPFAHHLIPYMTIMTERFKWSPPSIVYRLVLNIHVDEIKRCIT